MVKKFSFKLVSFCSNINFPCSVNDIKFIKLSKLHYKVTNPSIKIIRISIPSLNQHLFFDGEKNINYFFIFFNDGNPNNLIS